MAVKRLLGSDLAKTTAKLVEHPELVADRITFAEVVGQENVIAGTDWSLGGRVDPQIAWAALRALQEGAGVVACGRFGVEPEIDLFPSPIRLHLQPLPGVRREAIGVRGGQRRQRTEG